MSATAKRERCEDDDDNQNEVAEPQVQEEEEKQKVDFLALLSESCGSRVNMKDLPPRNKKGKINYFGYMDEYFQEKPPVPLTNLVIDNHDLRVICDRTGDF